MARKYLLSILHVIVLAASIAPFVVSHQDLHDVVAAGDAVGLRRAIEAGAPINAIGGGGQTPLMKAVLSGKDECVKVLLEFGADTSIPEKDGYTPMHGAGFQGRANIAEMLIDHGLDPSDRHRDGYTPIHRACWGSKTGHAEFIAVLIDAGVDPEELSGEGKTPLSMVRNNPTSKGILQKAVARKAEAGEVRQEL